MSRRSDSLPTSFCNASAQSPLVEAKDAAPLWPNNSRVASSGEATAGIPVARYCSALMGDLAAAKGLSASGSNPMSKVPTTAGSAPG